MKLKLTVNGELRVREVHPMKRLLDVLREDIRLTGAKEGCGEGECGACAVIMNGRLVNSCMVSALRANGSEILTIEGLGCSVALDALQTAFVEEGAIHCGFCTPGMIMAARALLERQQEPTLEDIKVALSGNLCRCTGYEKIYRAVDKAVKAGYSKAIKPFSGTNENIPELDSEEKSNFFSPGSLGEALDILSKRIPDLTILAGGTDIFPDVKKNKLKLGTVMDISNIPELKAISYEKRNITIGSCVTNTEIMESYLLEKNYPLIVQAASKCGAVAVQNMATIGGNIMTASGAADMVTALMALDAEVRIICKNFEETVIPIEKFIKGCHSTALKQGELLKEVLIPTPNKIKRYEAFYKRGHRRALTFARVSLACRIEINEKGHVSYARFAVGSMSAVPFRLNGVERMLMGCKIEDKLAESAAKKAGAIVMPRTESAYRKKVTENLVRKFLMSCME
ncbi:MAG: FAD binding domain-containing protein [Synergistaceae bacterium]|nr:FAD binding domain-containing protein [Synergistaceae bacterium]